MTRAWRSWLHKIASQIITWDATRSRQQRTNTMPYPSDKKNGAMSRIFASLWHRACILHRACLLHRHVKQITATVHTNTAKKTFFWMLTLGLSALRDASVRFVLFWESCMNWHKPIPKETHMRRTCASRSEQVVDLARALQGRLARRDAWTRCLRQVCKALLAQRKVHQTCSPSVIHMQIAATYN